MTEPLKEQLSACLDGELPPAELDLLLKQLAQDDELRRTADRYSRIGAVMADRQAPLASPDFAARVAAAIEQEPVPRATSGVVPLRRPARESRLSWLRPAISVAMAAGIATFAVLIVNRPDPSQPVPLAQSPDVQNVAPMSPAVPAGTANWSTEQLANYVVAHSEYSTPLGRTLVLNGLLADEPQTTQVDPADDVDTQSR